MSVSKRLRFEILRRDNHACRYCGATAPDVKLTVDHVVPIALGGLDEASNLVTACAACNGGKSSSNPDQRIIDDVSDQTFIWSAALDLALAEWRAHEHEVEAVTDIFWDAWHEWGHDEGDRRVSPPLDDNWRDSVKRWLAAGFTMDDLLGFIPSAMHRQGLHGTNPRWKYYCGIVWHTLDELQMTTAEIVKRDYS